MKEKLGTGVIGCGVMGKEHCANINKSGLMELAAVADIREESAGVAGKLGGAGKIYTEASALIKDPAVEAVVIAMPTRERTALAVKCFEAGKHVMLEKPVAMNAGEVERMIRVRGNLTAGCFSSRFGFLESAQAARDFVGSGAVGEIRIVRVRALKADNGPPSKSPPGWRLKKDLNGGGILVNWGCYDLDYVLGITGWRLDPEIVLARTWPLPPGFSSRAAPGSDAETHFSAFIGCKGGRVLNFERGEFMPSGEENAWQVAGSRGTLNMQMVPGKKARLVFFEGFPGRPVGRKVVWEGSENGESIHRLPLEDFVRAALYGSKPRTGLEESLVIQKITDAVYRSADIGEAVKIA